MANKNSTTPAQNGQVESTAAKQNKVSLPAPLCKQQAFTAAFCPQEDENQIDPGACFRTYLELAAAGDWTAAALAIGDAIVGMPNSDRACIVDLMIYLLEHRGEEIIK